MIVVTFPIRNLEKRSLGFLLGRFSGRALKSDEHVVPYAALQALADRKISFLIAARILEQMTFEAEPRSGVTS